MAVENQKLWYRQCHSGHFSLVRDEGSFHKVMSISVGNPCLAGSPHQVKQPRQETWIVPLSATVIA